MKIKSMQQIDLHVHSTRSDGTYTPSELVDYAMEKGLAAFALTDHDTTEGLDEAIEYAEGLRHRPEAVTAPANPQGEPENAAPQADAMPSGTGNAATQADATLSETGNIAEQTTPPLGGTKNAAPQTNTPLSVPENAAPLPVPEVIPGIEFSTEYQKQDVHIVGLYIDHHQQTFATKLREFIDSRTRRNLKMCRLMQEAGIDITYDALLTAFPSAVITRAHYARYLFEHGYVGSIKEAFDRYVGDHCPCYVPREKVTPVQAVELILEAGGIPVLAHPILYHMSDERLDRLTSELKEAGLAGIEAIYSTYKPYEERQIRALAAKYDLCVSGGSDFHGANKPGLDLGSGYGKLFVPYSVLEDLKAAGLKGGRPYHYSKT